MVKETVPEKEKKSKKQNLDKQFYWVLGTMVFLIAAFLVSFGIGQKANEFEHEGLQFKEEMFGEIQLYRHDYFTERIGRTSTGQIVNTGEAKNVIVYLRNDPRELTVPVEGKIEYLPKGKFIYITFSSEGLFCEYSNVAIANLINFLSSNSFVAKAAASDEQAAEESELQHITCENRPDHMVLSFQGAEETSIVREEDTNCYRINVANCEVLEAVDQFVVQSLIDAREE